MSLFRGPQSSDRAARVMIVDDDAEVVRLARRSLEMDGYLGVVCVTDPLLSADVARTERPDVLVIAASMPGVSGLDVLRALRSEPETSVLPVVLLCTVNDARARLASATMGVREFLAKPIDPLELLACVRDAALIGALSRTSLRRG